MRARNAGICAPFSGESKEWQRANDVWLNSTAQENRRRICRSKCYARTTAALISFRSPAVGSTANGAITSPAGSSRRRWWAGACTAPDSNAAFAALCQNATEIDRILRFRTRTERTAPESAVEARTPVFTARYRPQSHTAHHIQHYCDRPQQTATTNVNSPGYRR
jgi:hypothetical protein